MASAPRSSMSFAEARALLGLSGPQSANAYGAGPYGPGPFIVFIGHDFKNEMEYPYYINQFNLSRTEHTSLRYYKTLDTLHLAQAADGQTPLNLAGLCHFFRDEIQECCPHQLQFQLNRRGNKYKLEPSGMHCAGNDAAMNLLLVLIFLNDPRFSDTDDIQEPADLTQALPLRPGVVFFCLDAEGGQDRSGKETCAEVGGAFFKSDDVMGVAPGSNFSTWAKKHITTFNYTNTSVTKLYNPWHPAAVCGFLFGNTQKFPQDELFDRLKRGFANIALACARNGKSVLEAGGVASMDQPGSIEEYSISPTEPEVSPATQLLTSQNFSDRQPLQLKPNYTKDPATMPKTHIGNLSYVGIAELRNLSLVMSGLSNTPVGTGPYNLVDTGVVDDAAEHLEDFDEDTRRLWVLKTCPKTIFGGPCKHRDRPWLCRKEYHACPKYQKGKCQNTEFIHGEYIHIRKACISQSRGQECVNTACEYAWAHTPENEKIVRLARNMDILDRKVEAARQERIRNTPGGGKREEARCLAHKTAWKAAHPNRYEGPVLTKMSNVEARENIIF